MKACVTEDKNAVFDNYYSICSALQKRLVLEPASLEVLTNDEIECDLGASSRDDLERLSGHMAFVMGVISNAFT